MPRTFGPVGYPTLIVVVLLLFPRVAHCHLCSHVEHLGHLWSFKSCDPDRDVAFLVQNSDKPHNSIRRREGCVQTKTHESTKDD